MLPLRNAQQFFAVQRTISNVSLPNPRDQSHRRTYAPAAWAISSLLCLRNPDHFPAGTTFEKPIRRLRSKPRKEGDKRVLPPHLAHAGPSTMRQGSSVGIASHTPALCQITYCAVVPRRGSCWKNDDSRSVQFCSEVNNQPRSQNVLRTAAVLGYRCPAAHRRRAPPSQAPASHRSGLAPPAKFADAASPPSNRGEAFS
jgi:hypothetical protein